MKENMYAGLVLLVIGEVLFVFALVKVLSKQPAHEREAKIMNWLLTFGMLSGGMFLVGCILAVFNPFPMVIGLLGGLHALQWLSIPAAMRFSRAS